jgi:hypothetical protein
MCVHANLCRCKFDVVVRHVNSVESNTRTEYYVHPSLASTTPFLSRFPSIRNRGCGVAPLFRSFARAFSDGSKQVMVHLKL